MKKQLEIKKLGEVCDFQGGSQPPKSEFIFNERDNYVRFLQIRDFGNDNHITYIPKSAKNRTCNRDDILIGRYGASVGKILMNKTGAYNVAIIKTIPNFKIIDNKYLYYYLISDNFQKPLEKVAARSAQAGFSKDDIFNFSIYTPSLPEQHHIVSLLDDVFEKISKIKENTEKNLQNSKELFASYLDTIFTQTPSDYDYRKISEIADIKGGKRVPRGYKFKEDKTDHPYIRVSDFNDNGSVDLMNIKYIDNKIYEQIKKYIITTSDVYISIAGTIGKTGIIPPELEGANLTENACKLVFKENIFNKYIYYFTRSSEFIKQAGLNTRKVAMPKLALNRLGNILIPIPNSISEQKSIVAKLDALSAETKKLESIYKQKLLDLEELKKSILERAFNGEL